MTPLENAVVVPAKPRMTRARHGVTAFIVALAAVTYLDRACISKLQGNIRQDLGLTEQQMSAVFASFAIAYALFEIPTAWWAQRRGTRRVLTRIVVWWSLLTIATACVVTPAGVAGIWTGLSHSTAWIVSFGMMLSVRFLFGMGEAGAWPCAAMAFARWMPARERGIAQGLLFAGAHLSGGLTPLLVTVLVTNAHFQWREVFLLFGMVGFVWAAWWYWWYRDDPAQHAAVGAAELAAIVAGRREASEHAGGWDYWRRVFTHRNVIALCLMYIGNSYTYYFCITWLPEYVKEKHKMQGMALAIAAGLPLTLSVAGDIFGGMTTDYLTRRFGPRIGRSGLGAVCYALGAVAIVVALAVHQPWVAMTALSIAVAALMFTLGAAWGAVIEIGGHHTGMIGAVMNTAGNTAAIFSPFITIYMKDNWGGWNAPIAVIGGLMVIGGVAWCFVDPRQAVLD